MASRSVHDRDVPLSEGVVERVVDLLRRDAKPGGHVAVDHQPRLQPAVLLVAAHIDQFGQRPHGDQQLWAPGVEVAQGVGPEGVLILGTAQAAADTEILHRLHHEHGAGQGSQ